jgi:hypothetical protein
MRGARICPWDLPPGEMSAAPPILVLPLAQKNASERDPFSGVGPARLNFVGFPRHAGNHVARQILRARASCMRPQLEFTVQFKFIFVLRSASLLYLMLLARRWPAAYSPRSAGCAPTLLSRVHVMAAANGTGGPEVSTRITQTDPPCIVKTKVLVAGTPGTLSLAQGMLMW